MNAVAKGRAGEAIAAKHLEQMKYEIVCRNYRTRSGEVDIIATLGDALVFIEVKAWDTFSSENLQYAIARRKQATIIQTTRRFLQNHPEYREFRIRFDVIFLIPDTGEIKHIEDAFTETSNVW